MHGLNKLPDRSPFITPQQTATQNSFAPDQLTVADVEGRINNFIDVTHFKPFNEDSSTLDIARKEDEVRRMEGKWMSM